MANTSPARALSKQRFDRKTIDTFSSSDRGSVFAKCYSNRSLHCRVQQGSVKHALEWDTPPEHLDYDPLLVLFAEGLVETAHPLYFVARTGFKNLLEAPGAGPKAEVLVQRLIVPLRACLVSSKPEVYEAGLNGLAQLSATIGPALTPHLKMLVGQMAKNMTKAKLRDRITAVFNELETNGGQPVLKLIKSKVPVYCSINM